MKNIEQFGEAPVHVTRGIACNREAPNAGYLAGGYVPSWASSLYDGGGAGANWNMDGGAAYGAGGSGDMTANTGGKGEYYDLWNSIRDITGGLLSDSYGWTAQNGGAPGGRLDLDLFLANGPGSGWGGGIAERTAIGTQTGGTGGTGGGGTTGTTPGTTIGTRADWFFWAFVVAVILVLSSKKRGKK